MSLKVFALHFPLQISGSNPFPGQLFVNTWKKKEIIYKRNRFFLNNYTIQINTLVKHQLLKLRTISLNLTKLVYIQELK